MQQGVCSKAMVQRAQLTLVIQAGVKRGTTQTVLEHASKIVSTKIGLVMAIATTVHMFHQIMATAVHQVSQSG